ncbi:hypothetical protein [Nocardioides gilvus]|uniref:hypothetical protein n=1 Tax=Nocardioides gilvus TaxID=1735589 RepID=UPI000D743A49|nr:hypothetical protein [Nocardioides gilvus]
MAEHLEEAPLAERVAAWLEELGLDEYLAEAGLPTFVRDKDGRVLWHEVGGQEPLSPERLELLSTALRSQGDEPQHAVPVPLVLLARKARLRAALSAAQAPGYDRVAALRGATVNATRFAVHKAKAAGELLLVVAGERVLLPDFQFDASGEVRAELRPVLAPLLNAGMDPWDAWIWLTQPAGLLGGDVPERLAADPEEASLVAHAAVRLAERVAASPRPAPRPKPAPLPSKGCGCGGHH